MKQIGDACSGLPEFLTVEECAQLLRLNPKTVYEAIRKKQMPGVSKFGRVFRIHRATLLEAHLSKGCSALGDLE